MQRMPFIPAVTPESAATPDAWCFAFVEGQLLLPEQGESRVLAPQPWSLFEPLQPTRHYLGQLDGIDCWAFTLNEPPPGFKRMPLRAAMMAVRRTADGRGRARRAGARMGSRAPLLRRLRHAHRAAGRANARASARLRPHRLPAAEPGDHGAGVARGTKYCSRARRTTCPASTAHWPASSRPASRSSSACTAKWPKRSACR